LALVITAVKGILDALAAEQASSTKQSETLPKESKSENEQQSEVSCDIKSQNHFLSISFSLQNVVSFTNSHQKIEYLSSRQIHILILTN
jgi:hypothetical protein